MAPGSRVYWMSQPMGVVELFSCNSRDSCPLRRRRNRLAQSGHSCAVKDEYLQVATQQALLSGTDVQAAPSLLSQVAHSRGAVRWRAVKSPRPRSFPGAISVWKAVKQVTGCSGPERRASHGQLGSGQRGRPAVLRQDNGRCPWKDRRAVWPGHSEPRERKGSVKWGSRTRPGSRAQCHGQPAVCRDYTEFMSGRQGWSWVPSPS